MKRFILSSALGAAAMITIFACSHRTIEFERSLDDGSAPPSFAEADAAVDGATLLISYCPATRCTGNTTTCPTSRFRCDVDLRNDKQNCGACGVRCAGLSVCANGACAIDSCSEKYRDCNGSIEDGCETTIGTNDNCSDCGDVCLDPTRPCVSLGSDTYQCGCPSGQTLCTGRVCSDLSANDKNCGACGQACDPSGGGAPSYPNVYYGCVAGQCGKAKCVQGYADCNDDLADGCETKMGTAENCGGCGIACEPGQVCGTEKGESVCQCAADLKLCGSHCRDLQSDPWNCGACGVVCMESYAGSAREIGQCIYGSCVYECAVGWGDCNGDPSDSCETNLRSDPTNCGGCGVHCAEDQPCIGGRCAVEPCPDAGTSLQ